ncbi:MAG TPA: DNA cytosine methyltransferase [Sphingopyxis sp.]|nr:DNA cytosine methyltransferase [Sphingopyxis sp.]HMP46100.1 DNA cytosine methyltransferase [Sphingopyxis sp.]HMQ18603.1 DNA cytosine methyltransferase [Sphingopyxis sp.]
MRPIGIDLFAGAGGMSLGFEQAGFDIVAAVEIDPVHCAVHKFNFPHCAVIPRSVVGLTGNEIRVAAGIGRRRIDVVFGGAPCQGFSMIGQRAFDDPRNALVRDFLRIVSELDATYFVFENVKGLTIGRHRQFVDEIVATANGLGYDVLSPWRVLDAAHFGVPQHRERLFLYGAKRPKALPSYPGEKTTAADGRGKVSSTLPVGPNASEALSDIPDADLFEALSKIDEVRPDTWGEPSAYASELRCLTNDAWHFGYVRKWDPSLLTSSARTEHTDISRRRFAATAGGDTEPVSRFYKLAPNGVSNTLRAGTDGARGAFTSPRPIHHEHPRCVTVREMARLHGYPDWFRFNETKWHGARQIGNSVPPPLARAVAAQVLESMGVTPEQPFETFDLGDTALLRMNLSQAASYFGVPAIPSKRDRKSGATKRKQAEIEEMSYIEQQSLYA